MTDKVQKIREEVVRMHKLLPSVIDSNNITLDYADRICTTLEMFIDSMQEECNITGIKSKHAEGKLKECIESITEESLAKARKQLEEESVSEELEKAAMEYVVKEAAKDINGNWITDDILNAFKAGAKWQEEQFEKERLKHCDALTEEQAQIESDFVANHLKENNRTPTFIDAIEYGMRLQKEQMMAKAFDAVVSQVPCSNEIILRNPASVHWSYLPHEMNKLGLDKGDKVKVIIIKEEKL